MTVIETDAEVGADRMLHVRLPDDAPGGHVRVRLVIEAVTGLPSDAGERKAAARGAAGSLRHLGLSVESLLEERRNDNRRDEAR